MAKATWAQDQLETYQVFWKATLNDGDETYWWQVDDRFRHFCQQLNFTVDSKVGTIVFALQILQSMK